MTVPRMMGLREGGAGPNLVLGQSLGTSTVLWGRAVPLLLPSFNILSVDLPGHGESPAASEPFSVGELADAVVATADDAGVERFFYAGVSLGGQVALELALRHPDRVDGVAVICSAAKIGTPDAWRERAQSVRRQGTAVMVAGSAERWFAPGFIAANPEPAGALLNALARADDESYALCCEALAASDIGPRLRDLVTPTLVLWGDSDPVVSAEVGAALAAALPHARGVEVSGAGHLAPIERPVAVADAVIDFFREGTADG